VAPIDHGEGARSTWHVGRFDRALALGLCLSGMLGATGCGDSSQAGPGLWHTADLPVRQAQSCAQSGHSIVVDLAESDRARVASVPLVQAVLSPDGTRVAGRHGDSLEIIDLQTGDTQQVWSFTAGTAGAEFDGMATWSPASDAIVFTTTPAKKWDPMGHIWWTTTRTIHSLGVLGFPQWSPSGSYITDVGRTFPGGPNIVVDSHSGVVLRRFKKVSEVRWLPGRDTLLVEGPTHNATGGTFSSVSIWSPSDTLERLAASLTSPIISPSGRWIAGIAEVSLDVIAIRTGPRSRTRHTYSTEALLADPRIPSLASFYTGYQPVRPIPIVLALTDNGLPAVAPIQTVDEDTHGALIEWAGSGLPFIETSRFGGSADSPPSIHLSLAPDGSGVLSAGFDYVAHDPVRGPWRRAPITRRKRSFESVSPNGGLAFEVQDSGNIVVSRVRGLPKRHTVITNAGETYFADGGSESTDLAWAGPGFHTIVATCSETVAEAVSTSTTP